MGVDAQYVPIDISEAAMKALVDEARASGVGLPVRGLVADYAGGIRWISSAYEGRRSLVLFLGSNIGNFNRPQARSFLRRPWNRLGPGDSLLVASIRRRASRRSPSTRASSRSPSSSTRAAIFTGCPWRVKRQHTVERVPAR